MIKLPWSGNTSRIGDQYAVFLRDIRSVRMTIQCHLTAAALDMIAQNIRPGGHIKLMSMCHKNRDTRQRDDLFTGIV